MSDVSQGCFIIIAMVVIGLFIVFGFFSKHIIGNKQIIDFNHQRFNVAYVLGDSNKWEKVHIKAWKDWENSDSVQIITD